MRTIFNLTNAQQVSLVITPAISSAVSILGSGTILYSFFVIRSKGHCLSRIKNRLLAAICLSDLINSVAHAFWPLPIPPDSPGIWAGAHGNTATCSMQGFFMHIGNIGAAYNGALAIYFYLRLSKSLSDEVISKRYEIYMHLWGLLWPLVTGLIALGMGMFNFGGVGCWIAPYPYQCHLDDDVPCTRGETAYIYAWTFSGTPLLITNCIIVACMVATYQSIRSTYERAIRPIQRAASMGHFSQELAMSSQRCYSTRIRQAGVQALLYSAAYFVTHMWAAVIVGIENTGSNLYYPILWLHLFMWPLQGFFNVLIYLRPNVLYLRQKHPEWSYLHTVMVAAFRQRDAELGSSAHRGFQIGQSGFVRSFTARGASPSEDLDPFSEADSDRSRGAGASAVVTDSTPDCDGPDLDLEKEKGVRVVTWKVDKKQALQHEDPNGISSSLVSHQEMENESIADGEEAKAPELEEDNA